MSAAANQAPDTNVYLKDDAWIVIQKKTFTKWINSHLKKRGANLESIESGLADGILLIQLINILYDAPIPKYNKNPKIRAHLLDNVTLAMRSIEYAGVKLHNIKPVNILDCDVKLTLGAVWTIIHDYQIKGISVDELNAKEGLLRWVQRKTKGYKDVDVQNFTTSWRSGLAFCALIHAHRPDLIDFDALSKDDPAHNLKLAFETAENKLNITALLDVEDMLVEKPDEKSVMTYVSEYFHHFASLGEAETAGRRIGKFIEYNQSKADLVNKYVTQATKLVQWVKAKVVELETKPQSETGDVDYPRAKGLLAAYWQYKSVEKPSHSAKKVDTEALFSQLQTKLRAASRPPWVPPQGISPEEIEVEWQVLTEAEKGRLAVLSENIKRVRENLRVLFAKQANELVDFIQTKEAAINQISGDLDAQVRVTEELKKEIADNYPRLGDAIATNEKVNAAGIRDNAHTQYTVEELSLLWEELNTVLRNKVQLLENLKARQAEKERLRAELEAIERANEALRVQFAAKANAFVPWVNSLKERLDTKGDLEGQKQTVNALKEESRHGIEQLQELEQLQEQLHKRGVLDNKHTEYTVGELQLLFDEFANSCQNKLQLVENQIARRAEKERVIAEHELITKANESLKKIYAEKATALNEFVQKISKAISQLQGDLNEQKQIILNSQDELTETGSRLLSEFESVNQRVADANITENDLTDLTYEELSTTYSELVSAVQKKLEFVENQIVLKNMSKIPEHLLQEYQTSFNHFDKAGQGKLTRSEFKAAISAVGFNLSDEELNILYRDVDKTGDGFISFEEYTAFMISRSEDRDTKDENKKAFRLLAGGKDHIVATDLSRFVDKSKVEWFLEFAPRKDGLPDDVVAADYELFVDQSYV